MRIVHVNTVFGGSTGKIMRGIAQTARDAGHTVYTISRNWGGDLIDDPFHLLIGTRLDNRLHQILGTLSGFEGCFSRLATKRLLRRLDKIRPDVMHLHNLHGWYIHLPTLFAYIKKKNIRTVWTLHDCWAFTGKCPHFVTEGCDRWQTGCHDCPQLHQYPRSKCDRTSWLYDHKKRWFADVPQLTVVTPSRWLAGLVEQSFLKDAPVRVINNGIDLQVFRPTPSDFKERIGCRDKSIVLGVAFGWGYKKGLDVFLELARRLPTDRYQIVLVGTNEQTDAALPPSILSIHRTQDQRELAEIYSAADVFVNPTREDTFPTVNMEALGCGTPVLTFKVGGSPEILDEKTGCVVDRDDVDALERECRRICQQKPFSREDCTNRAKAFDKDVKYQEYIRLYRDFSL